MPVDNRAVMPAVFYEDLTAALGWLARAFGFEKKLVVSSPDGAVLHAQLALGDALIAAGGTAWAPWPTSPRALHGANTQTLHVAVNDADAHCARAREAGATILAQPEDQFYGDRAYRVSDCEGHCWTFFQHLRDVPPDEMARTSGFTVETFD